MKSIRYIFVSLLIARGLGSPVLMGNVGDTNVRSSIDNQELFSEFNKYFADKVQLCIDQAPANHGLLIYLQQQSPKKISPSRDEQADNGTRYQKRFFKSLYKTFKGMPAEQRIGVFSTMVSAYTLPAYMTSAAQAWDTEQISNIKSKAAEMEVKKSKGGKSTPKPKKNPKVLIPPPILPIIHVKRSLEKRGADLRKIQKAGSMTKSILHSSHGPGSVHAIEAGMHSPAHSALSRVGSSHSSPAKPEPKKPKQANPTVSKVLTWVGGSIQLLYIPVGWMTTHKVQRVTDDDTHSYRKRNYSKYSNEEFPTITCIPIAQRGHSDFIIPKGALS
ncbi:uncharacterized protein FA14DRAFT_156566 [Meira miltonrushii]|uniref:Uncharacterized protein n=1 Tax=Meira miltonrushii TaxID=1280837 RepID=A0A316V9Z7_9BASI|nr:uncharacterized protein FA14DRAFT_156566 [Meira miltonrushii]PWN33888.1 hypothetical protein FA14DRAFT_156566 [Meira miltonrushii]